MKNIYLFIGIILVAAALPTLGQMPQLERARQIRERAVKAEKDREQAKKDAAAGKPGNAASVAIMNVDVQMVLSNSDLKSFDLAKPTIISTVKDGQPLWLYLKFKGKLGDYVKQVPGKTDTDTTRYILYAEIGPQGEISTQYQYILEFTKDDLALTELKINLAPGMFGRNKSLGIFLDTAGNSRPGVWNNEFRLTNKISVPRGPTENLAKAAVKFDFSAGLVKYPKMYEDYYSIVLRGTTDTTKMPFGGAFYDESLKAALTSDLTAKGILPARIYFSGDAWSEFASVATKMKSTRKAFAVYTYRKADACYYGVADIEQVYESLLNKYQEPKFTLQKENAISCTDLN